MRIRMPAHMQCTCLQCGIEDPVDMPQTLALRRRNERQFLEQLLDTSKIECYRVPVPIKADLRKYQQVSECQKVAAMVKDFP